MGAGKSVPVANDTRWNSTYIKLESIAALDASLLSSVLQQTHHDNIIMLVKEYDYLKEIIEATDFSQGDKTNNQLSGSNSPITA